MNHLDLINACQNDWHDYTHHIFVQQLASGELNPGAYLHYLKQDFLFLKHYARAYALAIFKARTLDEMRRPLPGLQALIGSEMHHHISYCEQWGLTESDMEAEAEDVGTVAYTRYVLDTGMAGDMADLFTALAPCAIGYAMIGERLIHATETNLTNNPYSSWITLYGGESFQHDVQNSIHYLNSLLEEISVHSPRGQQLINIFRTATRMEVAFWQQGLNAAEAS
ncbi:thiaminase II [Photobacterium sp. CCB-ST2H9]|uniref:thiaminase II n=1 Tax=Photobacterium sp. CCB-ST2H9 TaxID=2912855 RepID=UPI00200660F3|nr:thiaminase II [Photobacterium sp. CCB-ST2H9]UTM60234.1 thiaminase II [Photobacterium sp. CCB-ST2H9]